MLEKLNYILDNLISDEIKNDSKKFMQARLLVKFIFLCIISSSIFLFVYNLISLSFSFYLILGVSFIFLIILFLLKYTKDTFIHTKVVIVSCFVIILSITLDTGGNESPAIPVFTIIPIIGFLLGTKWDGLLCTALTAVTIVCLYSLSFFDIYIVNNIDHQYQTIHEFVFNMFTFSFILLMILNYDNELTSSNQQLKTAVKKLQASEVVMKEISEQAINFSQYLGEAEEELKASLKKEKKAKNNLQQTQTKLVQSEKMASIGQLTAGIAHEINNPINFIQTGIAGLGRNLEDIKEVDNKLLESFSKIINEMERNVIADPNGIIKSEAQEIEKLKSELYYDDAYEEIGELISSIKNGANRTSEIVLGLRTFSRLDEGAWKLTDLEANIDSTLVLLKNKYKDRVGVVKEYTNIPMVECYPGKLNQVFMNLLVNGLQAIQGEGTLTIKTAYFENTKKVRISISDTGTGIPVELQEKIYDPFFTTKDVGEGTGLGLAITKGIIAGHNAELTFDTNPNGTTFNIDIQVSQPNKKDNHE